VGVTVTVPVPVPAAALKNLTGAGAVAPAGIVTGNPTLFDGQALPVQAPTDTCVIVLAFVGNVCVPLLYTVEVALRLQPLCWPFSVTVKPTLL
jgi:hypothetical protein